LTTSGTPLLLIYQKAWRSSSTAGFQILVKAFSAIVSIASVPIARVVGQFHKAASAGEHESAPLKNGAAFLSGPRYPDLRIGGRGYFPKPAGIPKRKPRLVS